MDHFFQTIALCSFLVGALPLLFARSVRARIAAGLFACLSAGLAVYFLSTGVAALGSDGWRHAGLLVVAELVLAYASLIITFRLDKR